MKGPLQGIRVVEISLFQQGPVAGMRLGDLGADVIKIEAKYGDPARGMMKIIRAMNGLSGKNYYFEHCNRNKRSIMLDLKAEKGKEIFYKLIDSADVFLNNMSIDAPARMGISPDKLLTRNPRLIYAHASGWGRKGPDAKTLSFDYTGIARSGLMLACGEKGTPPSQMLPGIGDEVGALICAWGITAALYAREKTGKGQVVDTSLMGSIISSLGLIMAAPAMLGQEFPRSIRATAGNPLYNHYRCSDDKWLAIAHLDPDKYWPNLCKALGMDELINDDRFNNIRARGKNAPALIQIMDEKFSTKTRTEWTEILKEQHIIFTPVQGPQDVVNDPQALANDYMTDYDHPDYGNMRVVGFPWDFSETPASIRKPAPKLGEHTEEIMKEIGYSDEEIEKLMDELPLAQSASTV